MLPDLSCSPDPEPPAGDDPVEHGVYELRLWQAGQSCREAVAAYRELRAAAMGAAAP